MRRRIFGDAVVGEGNPLKRKLQAKPVVADNVEGDALPLSLLMKGDWCTGKLSSKRIQEYCAGAVKEGSNSIEVHRMSRIGAGGKSLGVLFACKRILHEATRTSD